MSLWKRTMDYLGLGPDDAYDDYDDYDEPVASAASNSWDTRRRSASQRLEFEPTRLGTRGGANGAYRVGPPELPVARLRRVPVTTRRQWALG